MRMIGYVVMGLLAGCVTASQVSPIGPGLYVVTGHASGGLNAGKGVSAAAQTGNAFCTARHQVMAVDKTETHGMAAVGGESNTLTFRCVGP